MAATTGATIFCARWTDPGKKGVRKMKIIRQGKTAILLAAALYIVLFAIFPAQSLASESVTDRPSLDSENHNAYLVGYEDGTVRPQKAITRAEVATIFFRLLTEDGRDRYLTTENDFSDVAADAWYNTPVSTLAGAGMLSGYEDGSFRPDAAITRAEFAAMALRFLEEDGLVTPTNGAAVSPMWATPGTRKPSKRQRSTPSSAVIQMAVSVRKRRSRGQKSARLSTACWIAALMLTAVLSWVR